MMHGNVVFSHFLWVIFQGKIFFFKIRFLSHYSFSSHAIFFHFKQKNHSSPNSIARPAKLSFKFHYNRPKQIGAQNHIEKHIKPQSNYSFGAQATQLKNPVKGKWPGWHANVCFYLFIYLFIFKEESPRTFIEKLTIIQPHH